MFLMTQFRVKLICSDHFRWPYLPNLVCEQTSIKFDKVQLNQTRLIKLWTFNKNCEKIIGCIAFFKFYKKPQIHERFLSLKLPSLQCFDFVSSRFGYLKQGLFPTNDLSFKHSWWTRRPSQSLKVYKKLWTCKNLCSWQRLFIGVSIY